MSSIKLRLVNKKGVKNLALDASKLQKAGKFTRVGSDFYVACEVHLQQYIVNHVKNLPSLGKTIY